MKLWDAARAAGVRQANLPVRNLKTPWTDSVTEETVWQEYPRPQMVRDSWQNLNGYWCYAIRRDQQTPGEWDGQILVPFSPEAPLSGVNRQLQPGETLWYGREFQIPEWEDGHWLLHFGGVDERCRVWVNGNLAGSHAGGYLPFTLDITGWLKTGTNTLMLDCQDDSDTSWHTRGKQMLKRGGMFYTAQSGIWQTVWLEHVPEIYIESLEILPDYDRSQVTLQVHLQGEQENMAVICRATVTGEQGQRMVDKMGQPGRMSLAIPQRIPWTPEQPYLYGLQVTLYCQDSRLRNGEPLATDTVDSYFAMRHISVETDERGIPRLCLNHRPYFQHGVLDQGYWPDGLLTAPCDEALVHDIMEMKKAGFNMLRKHCKVEPLRWYYHCDRLGMLVWQDMVNGGTAYDMLHLCYLPTLFPSYGNGPHDIGKYTGRSNHPAREEWYGECEATIRLLKNHPCITTWVLFNEGWGQFEAEKTMAFARRLDESRPIDGASGWFDHGIGDVKSVHNYFRKLKCPSDGKNLRKGVRRALVISEYGGVAYPVREHTATGKTYGYRNLKSKEEWQRRAGGLLQAARRLEAQGLSAAVYTQVSDIEDEVNGILTYDRKVNKWDSGL